MTTTWQVTESDFLRVSNKLETLIRYAILAPSSHNMQPWKFHLEADEIHLFVDRTRWLEIADADQRELHISLGCALENLLIAAEYFGYDYVVRYLPDPQQPDLIAIVRFTGQSKSASLQTRELFYAIPLRYTDRSMYSSKPLRERDLEQIQAGSREKEVTIYLTGDATTRSIVDELMVRADALLFADPKFRQELGKWIGQGALGQPWLIAKLGRMAVAYLNLSKNATNPDSEVVMNAPVLGFYCTQENDRASQVKVGQAFERLALTATMLSIGVQPMNQILQIPECRAEVQPLLPLNDLYPQFAFRLGYVEAAQTISPRREIGEVLF